MSELAAALRQLADRIEKGELIDGEPCNFTQAAIVVANESGVVNAVYIGRLLPAAGAGVHLMAQGILKYNQTLVKGAAPAHQVSHGSTH